VFGGGGVQWVVVLEILKGVGQCLGGTRLWNSNGNQLRVDKHAYSSKESCRQLKDQKVWVAGNRRRCLRLRFLVLRVCVCGCNMRQCVCGCHLRAYFWCALRFVVQPNR